MDHLMPEPPVGTVVRTARGYEFKRTHIEDGPRWAMLGAHNATILVGWEYLGSAYGTPTIIADETRTVVPGQFYDDLNRELQDPQWRHAFDTNQAHLETIDMVINLLGDRYLIDPTMQRAWVHCTDCDTENIGWFPPESDQLDSDERQFNPVELISHVLRHNLEHHS